MESNSFFFNWEIVFTEFLQSFESPVLNSIASFFTIFGEELVLVSILGLLYWCYDKELGKKVGASAVCTLTAGPLVKNIALRRRPYFDNKNIKCIRAVNRKSDIYNIAEQGYSMPSMHAANSISIYGSFAAYFKSKAVKTAIAVLIFLIGLSRIFLGVHYATDILAGWVLGIAVTTIVYFLVKKFKDYFIIAAIFGTVSLSGWFYCKSNDFFTSYGIMLGVLLGFGFESRFVNFENTKSILHNILRFVCGIAIFMALCEGLKLPFDSAFLEENRFLPHLIRSARYLISSFVAIGVYPMLFKIKTK